MAGLHAVAARVSRRAGVAAVHARRRLRSHVGQRRRRARCLAAVGGSAGVVHAVPHHGGLLLLLLLLVMVLQQENTRQGRAGQCRVQEQGRGLRSIDLLPSILGLAQLLACWSYRVSEKTISRGGIKLKTIQRQTNKTLLPLAYTTYLIKRKHRQHSGAT